MADVTHKAHRYAAGKAYLSMVKYQDGNIETADMLLRFIGCLSNLQPTGQVRVMLNKFGGLAQQFKFKTTFQCDSAGSDFWHGTTFQCPPDIVRQGLKNPYDLMRTFQAFIEVEGVSPRIPCVITRLAHTQK